MKRLGLFALVLGIMTLSACGDSEDEAVQEEIIKTTTTCSYKDETQGFTAVIYGEDDAVVGFDIISSAKFSDGLTKEQFYLLVEKNKTDVPEGVTVSTESDDDSYTMTMEIDLTRTSDEAIEAIENSYPIENVKTATIDDFIKSWEDFGLTCEQ